MNEHQQIRQISNWLGTGSINVFGRPFSGKDTQAKQLSKLFGAPIIGGGEIIRSSNLNDIKQIISGGNLAPTKDYLKIVLPFFSQPKFANLPLVLSSVGRWQGEEAAIVEALEQSNHPLKAVILLNINEAEVKTRWQAAKVLGDRGNRSDDAHGKLDVRLSEFTNKTIPVIDYYRKNGLLIEVDGSLQPSAVTQKIIRQLLKKSSNN